MQAEIPSYLIYSMVFASIAFMVAVWLMVQLATKNIQTSLKIGIGLVAWYFLVFFLGKIGFFGQVVIFVPFMAFAFVVLAILVKVLYGNSFLRSTFEAIPVHWLIGVQIFRVMGYGFLTFYFLGLIPGEFAIPTGVGDLIIGFTAPLVAYLYVKKRARSLAVIWNWVGIGDLVLALTLGTFTYPRPFQVIPTQPDNALVALFPLVLVPLFAVPVSILLHLFTLRAIRRSA